MQKFSLSVAKIEMLFEHDGNKSPGGLGTAFFYKLNDSNMLITNWHNVIGLNVSTLKPIHSQGLIPNTLRVHYKRWDDLEKTVMRSAYIDISLYENGVPIWFEHKDRQQVDVVALPILTEKLEGFANESINLIDQEPRLVPYAGMDCFILGFPEGLVGAANTPIWKRGSIAAEPYLDRPYYVDAATRKGMSGSPVIARHSGIFGMDGGKLTDTSIIGTVEKFVAIYSGRVGDDAFGFQLGTAWQAGVLEDILGLATKGKHPLL